jgi:FkbM family methyltransferase
MEPQVWAGLATVPERERSLRDTVASLIGQVDMLGVYLDDWGENPVPPFLDQPKIRIERGMLGDAGKFSWAQEAPDLYLACDDDLVYPSGYPQTMRAACDIYGRDSAVSLHGRIFGPRPHKYHCLAGFDGDHVVHAVGTGALAFHAPTLHVTIDEFPVANMADIWFAKRSHQRGTPLIALGHGAGYLQHISHPHTIWDETSGQTGTRRDTSRRQQQLINETDWRLNPAGRPRVAVSILTYNRAAQLRTLLDSLELEAERFGCSLEVRIHDDASDDWQQTADLCRHRGYSYRRNLVNLGRVGHWHQVARELQDLYSSTADWFLFLPDDYQPVPHFFSRSLALWPTLTPPAALNLAHWRERAAGCWTGMRPRGNGQTIEIGWVDGLYLCRRDLLEKLKFTVRQVEDWWLEEHTGSGVGSQISKRLHERRAHMYRPERSLAIHQPVPSRMHPELRERETHTVVDPYGELDGCQLHEIGPLQIAAPTGDHLGRWLSRGIFYEQDLLEALRPLDLAGVAVDVGAYIGNHSAFFASELGLDVVAVEPSPDSYRLLRITLERSGLLERVEAIWGAIHPTWRTASLAPGPPNNGGMASVRSGGIIPCYRLDDLVCDRPVCLLKVDAEGLSAEVLASATETLRRWRPVICAETRDETEQVRVNELMARHGYEPSTHAYGTTPVWIWQSKTRDRVAA